MARSTYWNFSFIIGLMALPLYSSHQATTIPLHQKKQLNKSLLQAARGAFIIEEDTKYLTGPDIDREMLMLGAEKEVLDPFLGSINKKRREWKDDNVKFMAWLIEQGANPNSVSSEGLSPLMYAATYRKKDPIIFLLSKNAHINLQNQLGQTALMKAAAAGYPDMVVLLLQHGADPNIQAKNGDTFFTFAKKLHPLLLSDKDVQQALTTFDEKVRKEAEATLDPYIPTTVNSTIIGEYLAPKKTESPMQNMD